VADTGPAYSELGMVLDRLASKRRVRGPHRVARYIQQKTGRGPTGSAWQQIFTGETKNPTRKTIRLFVEAFELDEEEQREVARAYLFIEDEE
jgi:hypothetical protein